MAYVITKTTGEQLAVVNDGTIDQTTSLTLVGRNYSNFGQIINENFVQLLENFSSSTAPTSPLAGQLWYDSGNKKLKIYNGSAFLGLPQLISEYLQPSNQSVGDLWFNKTELKLYYFDGNNYNLIGPQTSEIAGNTAVLPTQLTDTGGNVHYVLSHVVQNYLTGNLETIAITATEPFTTTDVVGYSSLKRGINLYGVNTTGVSSNGVSQSTDTLIWGSAQSALSLADANGQYYASDFVKSATPQVTGVLNVSVGAATAITINNTDFTIGVDQTSNASLVTNGKQISFGANDGTRSVTIMKLDVTNGPAILPNSTSTNIGSTSLPFHYIYVNTATSVLADIAERYRADALYNEGTVLVVGGNFEVTICRTYQDESVAGIVSIHPAYAMNEDLGPPNFAPFIALKGRVPCKVKGPVKKGNLLVTSDFPGHAEVKKPESPYAGIVGKALQDFDGDYGIIEVMV